MTVVHCPSECVTGLRVFFTSSHDRRVKSVRWKVSTRSSRSRDRLLKLHSCWPMKRLNHRRFSEREKESERERSIDPTCCSVAVHLNSSRAAGRTRRTLGPYISSAAVRWRTLAALHWGTSRFSFRGLQLCLLAHTSKLSPCLGDTNQTMVSRWLHYIYIYIYITSPTSKRAAKWTKDSAFTDHCGDF